MHKGTLLLAACVMLTVQVSAGAQVAVDTSDSHLEAAKRRMEERRRARLEAERQEAEREAKSRRETPEAALATYAGIVKAETDRFTAAVGAARTGMLKELEAQKAVELKAGRSDEAQAIQSVIDSPRPDAKGSLARLRSDGARQSVKTYTDAVQAATTRRDSALSVAVENLVKVLQVAENAALRESRFDQAKLLRAELEKVRGKLPVFELGDAQRIVFVCDATGTMINKFSTLANELLNVILKLEPTRSYNVIFFTAGGKYHVVDKDALMPANDANKARFSQSLEGLRPTGTTNPIPAIEAAFKQSPQVVFFLSDGEFNNLKSYDEVIATFRKANVGRKVKVNTLLFLTYDREAEEAMQTIAEENGGTYRYVHEPDPK